MGTPKPRRSSVPKGLVCSKPTQKTLRGRQNFHLLKDTTGDEQGFWLGKVGEER